MNNKEQKKAAPEKKLQEMNAAEAAWLLYCQVEEGRTTAELPKITNLFKQNQGVKKK